MNGYNAAMTIKLTMQEAWDSLWPAAGHKAPLNQEAIEARLRLLQGQIAPDFLFNTLANVQSLMDVDAARARQMLEAYSDYLRAGLTQLRQLDTTLGAELDMAQTYLELMQIRMLDRLNFSIEAGPEARAAHLPALLLQPLVENAILHGLEPKPEGGRVSIRATLNDGRLEVSVVDDGVGLAVPYGGSGMALWNVQTRLQTRYGDNAGFTLAPLECGTHATLHLPCEVAA